MKELSVIYVNWNSLRYLRESLQSLYLSAGGLDFEVIVVDNASSEGDLDSLTVEFPGVVLLKSEQNLGFARANNLGYEHSSGKYILFLNPDTKILGNAIVTVHDRLKVLPHGAIAGCRLLNRDLSLQTSCIQRYPTILNQVFDIDWLRVRRPLWRLWGMEPLFNTSAASHEVEVISGACLMIRRDSFARVGGFSPEFFMYGDDVDLCYKISRLGLKAYYISDATVVHYGGESSRQRSVSQWSAIMQRKAIMTFCSKAHGRLYAALYRCAMAVAALFRVALLLCDYVIGNVAGKSEGLHAAFGKWTAVLRWAVGFDRSMEESN